jgi:hypothetical protein
MKAFSRFAMAALLAMSASVAVAGPTSLQFDDIVSPGTFTINGFEYVPARNGTMSVTGLGTVQAGVGAIRATFDDGLDDPLSFNAFCVELLTSASGFGNATSNFLIGSTTSTALSKLFSYNDVANGGVNGDGTTSVDRDKSAGLQLAVWELLYDTAPGNVSSGQFSSTVNATSEAWANSLLAGATGANANYNLQLISDNDLRSKPTYQDFVTASIGNTFGCNEGDCGVTPVPEPSSIALTLAGLAALGFISRRRKVRA